MPPRRRNQPCGAALPPNQNTAFDQQLVVSMIKDLRRQIEALAQHVAERENPSQMATNLRGMTINRRGM
jgi:hypothetical protein